jgi:hypothetical protein
MKSICLLCTLFFVSSVHAAPTASEAPGAAKENEKIHYRAAKDVSFDRLLIEGEMKRPDMHVVTGDSKQGSDGMLRLRQDFLDHINNDLGEEIP